MTTQHSTFPRWLMQAVFLALLALALSGCRQPTGKVTGKVSYKGEPVSAGTVAFFGPGDKVASAALQPDGFYEASAVPVGLVKVSVTTPVPGPTKEQAANNPMMKRRGFVPSDEKIVSIPPKYNLPGTSGLSLTVTEGSHPFDIELK
jgi:hypothetical protein